LRSQFAGTGQFSLPLEFRDKIMTKVSHAIGHVLDAMVNPDEVKKAREEAKGVLQTRARTDSTYDWREDGEQVTPSVTSFPTFRLRLHQNATSERNQT
jgi:hypothetical protein